MSYFIQKPSRINPSITVYYAGSNRWTDNSSEKMIFENESDASTLIENPDGRNGGWKDSTIVSE